MARKPKSDTPDRTLVFTVASRGDYHLLAHRPTCKRVVLTKAVEQPSQHDRVEPAGCCKPNADTVREAVAAMRQAQPEAHADKAAPSSRTKLHERVRDVPTDNPDATADPDPRKRAELAKAEWKALQAWAKAGEQPPRPATPNLDALNAEYAAGVTAKARRKAPTARKAPAVPRAKNRNAERPAVQFLHDDKPMVPNMNSVACLAYNYTKGVDGDRRRISSAELRAILTAAGITDPDTTSWEFTLPNGVRLAARTAQAEAVA